MGLLKAVRADITAITGEEVSRIMYWMPVLFGVGIWLRMSGEVVLHWQQAAAPGFVCACALWYQRARLRVALPLASLCLVCAGLVAADSRLAFLHTPVLSKDVPYAQIRGQIITLSSSANGRTQFDIAPDFIEGHTRQTQPVRLRLTSHRSFDAKAGERVELAAKLWPPGEPVSPGAFNYRRYLQWQKTGGLGVVLSSPVKIADAEGARARFRYFLFSFRDSVKRAVLQDGDSQASAVAVALMLGDRGGISHETEEALRGSGLAHILAISGMHMALFVGAVFYGVRMLLVLAPWFSFFFPVKKWAAGVALAAALFYLVLTGASIATQRAFIMAALVLIAIILDRPAMTMRNVAIAAMIVLLVAPESLMSASFHMSFAAVVALIGVYEWIEAGALLSSREWRNRLSAGYPFWLYTGGLLLTSLVAGLATAPFAAFHFNRVAVYGLIGNLAAMPLTGLVVMPAAVAGYVLMPFGLEALPLAVMKWGIALVLAISAEVSSWSGALRMVPAGPALALGCIVFGGLWLFLWRTRWRLAGVFPVLAGIMLWAVAPRPVLFIAPDGQLVAMRNQQGYLEFSARSPKRIQKQWLRRDADPRPVKESYAASSHWYCDSEACLYREEGNLKISILKEKSALHDDCLWADIVVAPFYVSRKKCPSAHLVDRAFLERSGAVAVYRKGGDLRIEGTRTGFRQ